MPRILFFIQTTWAFGSLHYELCKFLQVRGVVSDLLDWRRQYVSDEMKMMLDYYEYVVTVPGESVILTNSYGVPHDRIIVVAHAEHDLRVMLRNQPSEEFDKYAGYAVISEFIRNASVQLGIPRIPDIVRIGINCEKFSVPIAPALRTVGYGGTMYRTDHAGVDIKRGVLVEQAAEAAGLAFMPAGEFAFQTMPQYYKQVDAVLVSSLTHGEGCALPGMEAAAAGRLVFSTSAGYFPELPVARHAGLIAPLDSGEYQEFATRKLLHFKERPDEYADICRIIQEDAKQFDWQFAVEDWLSLFSHAGGRGS
jgi:hypothetical protein